MKSFDLLSNPKERVSKRTWTGGLMTIVSIFVLLFFLRNEYSRFAENRVTKTIFVDSKVDNKPVDLNFGIKLPKAPCSLISVDSEDSLGHHNSNIDMFKAVMDKDGQIIHMVDLKVHP